MSAPIIKQLSPDDRPWRIDWFGEVSYPDGASQRSQPSVAVSISPLACDIEDRQALLSSDATYHRQQRTRRIPIGLLPCIKIGDIWQRGRCIVEPAYQEEVFRGVEIEKIQSDKNIVNIIKSGLSCNDSYLLPLDEHPWHRQQTHSYCVCVALPDNKRLIAPCMELIRFYFGSSSGLLHKLFTGPLTENTLWQHKNYDPCGELYLKLADGISSFSAEDVGRIANSREAWRSARMIFYSCLSASFQGLPVYPYTTFPLEGKTDLAAAGKWTSHQGVPNSTFVVFKLKSCSHPFPFRELRYEVSDHVRIRKPKNTTGPSDPDTKPGIITMTKPSGTSLGTAEPGTSKLVHHLKHRRNVKFPDLFDKCVRRVKYETADRPEVMRINQEGGIEKAGTGAGTSSGEARQVDLVPDQRKARPASKEKLPAFVREGARLAIAQMGVNGQEVTWLPMTLPGYTEPVISLPILIDEHGVINEIVLHSADGTVRQRRACFVHVEQVDQNIGYAFIVEAASRFGDVQVQLTDAVDLVEGLNLLIAGP